MQRISTAGGSISALNVGSVLDALERLGIDGARVLAQAGATVDEVRAPNARIPAALELDFWDALVKHTEDGMIGLRVAEQIQIGALGAYEYLLRNCQTIRTAIEQATKFERVIDELTRVRIVESEHEAAIRHFREGGFPHSSYGSECLFAVLLRLGETVFPSERAIRISFVHAPHAELEQYRAYFDCPVSFNAQCNEIVIPRRALDMPLKTADPTLERVLEEHMTNMLERLPTEDPFVQRARRLLGDALQRRADVSLEQLAAALHMSERTLRRRLEENGTSYKLLLDELRRELACHYVTRTQESFEETGARLGFADISAFYRAFKRWTSTTPAAYRESTRGTRI